MGSIESLKKRRRGIDRIGRLTKALQLVSMVRFKGAQSSIEKIKPYYKGMRSLGERILSSSQQGRDLFLLIASDEGFVGDYNQAIFDRLEERFVSSNRASPLVVIGEKGEERCQQRGFPIEASFPSSPSIIPEILSYILEERHQKRLQSLTLIYYPYASHRGAIEEQIFPFKAPKRDSYLLEPSREEVVEALLPRYLRSSIEMAIYRGKANEEFKRMMMMIQATEKAEEMLEEISMAFNQARQGNITRELLEITSGSMEV